MYGIQIAFRDFKFNKGITGSEWVGLKHFYDLFSRPSFLEVFTNTIKISTYKLIFGFPVPIIFALLLNELRMVKFKKAVQTISYLPHFVSWVILGGLFLQLLSPTSGPLNILLRELGMKPIYFLGDNAWFVGTLVVTSIWKSVGWSSIIYLAAIAGVNSELYEAGNLDGCNRFQLARYITFPAIMPIVTIMFIFAVGGIVADDFDQIFNLYSPAVYKVGDVLGTYAYRNGIESMDYSFATAVGLFTNIVSLVLVLSANFFAKRYSDNGIW
ncbi:ABC transporter permease [Paenibacillus lignilyticus]|nr:ABC transporter permease subunit [Paenibacillus lignilyticus]